jgi:Tol biopolymer transport system component/plastocyanin
MVDRRAGRWFDGVVSAARPGRRWVVAGALAALAAVAALLVATRPWKDDGQAKAAVPGSFDSLAPPNAPPHWLPPEDWVYNHWLPYDEGRLYALLGVTRGDIWRQLRDDHHNIAELARAHGWPSPAKLASALVAPRRGDVPAATLAVLRARALRTVTQGHLAQHLLFHSLHQFAIPSEAPDIFGVTDAEFRALRRGEQSPLDIGRVHGRSPSQIQALAAAVLRERVQTGVRAGATSAQQGRLLLARQLAQLPRWLAQVRYNGPPPTHAGELVRPPRDFAANPALSADGRHVVFESYVQKLPLALARGEISVQTRGLDGSAPVEVSQPNSGRRRGPRSAYNPSVSADGNTVAFESAEGNRNFAKRYGSIRVLVRDVAAGVSHTVGRPGARVSQSEFNPVVSGDGSAVAYQAVRHTGHSQVLVTRVRSRDTTLASRRGRSGPGANADTYEPSIDGDGERVAFTSAAPNLGARGGRSQVFVRDLRRGRTRLVSHSPGYASSPAISPDGRYVAYVTGSAGHGTRVLLRDLKRGITIRVSGRGDGAALGPTVSAGGRFVAYTSVARGRSSVVVRDVRRAAIVTKVPDGEDASIAADGRLVAFSSTATGLAPGKPDDRRGVFVRNLRSGTTRLVSAPAPPGDDAATHTAAQARPSPASHLGARQVAILDNAFHHGRDRPTVHLRAGQRLTWLWRSQQSHQVTVATGAHALRSPTQAHGRFSVRLTRPGTYDFVCSIHAPGMHMTAVVRRAGTAPG